MIIQLLVLGAIAFGAWSYDKNNQEKKAREEAESKAKSKENSERNKTSNNHFNRENEQTFNYQENEQNINHMSQIFGCKEMSGFASTYYGLIKKGYEVILDDRIVTAQDFMEFTSLTNEFRFKVTNPTNKKSVDVIFYPSEIVAYKKSGDELQINVHSCKTNIQNKIFSKLGYSEEWKSYEQSLFHCKNTREFVFQLFIGGALIELFKNYPYVVVQLEENIAKKSRVDITITVNGKKLLIELKRLYTQRLYTQKFNHFLKTITDLENKVGENSEDFEQLKKYLNVKETLDNKKIHGLFYLNNCDKKTIQDIKREVEIMRMNDHDIYINIDN